MMPDSVFATDPGNVVEDTYFVDALINENFRTYSSGQTFGGWRVTQGNVDLNKTYFTPSIEETNTVDLNGLTTGGISQVLETVPGKTYVLRFKVSGNWESTTSNRAFRVTAGPLSRSLAVARPTNWSRTNMRWRALSYPFIATSSSTTLTFTSTSTGTGGAVIAEVSVSSPPEAPKALETIPVPLPPDLDKYVSNKEAAIALGKALFWDMQVGSDGKTACATCHWHAGADARTKNTLHPGAPGSAFGHQTSIGPALAADALANFPGVNLQLKPEDFPFRRLENMDLPESDSNRVIFDSKKVTGSQGVVSKNFLNIVEGNPVDNGQNTPHPVFNIHGTNIRQVTGRNAPTTINAVFFDRSFWDGRANRFFNGVNEFGDLDPNARVLKATTKTNTSTTVTGYKWVIKWIGWWPMWSYEPVTSTKTETVESLEPVRVLIDNAALASQAVGPVNSAVEMAWLGRPFPEVARKMFSLRPLAVQEVSHDDSVLGMYVDASGHGLKPEHSYQSFIREAFQPEWWSSSKTTDDGYTQMEKNFTLFWGLSVMLYESTLVSDDAPYDQWRKGDEGALSAAAKRGLKTFLNEGKCINCHGGPEFASGTVSQIRGVLSNDGGIELMPMARGVAFYDQGYYNIGVRQTEEDIGIGAAHPQFGPLSYSRQRQAGRNVPDTDPVPSGARVAVDGAFKSSTLRNIELTGPYFHNGGTKNLLEVVEFYTRGADFRKTNIRDLDPDVGGIPELQGNEQAQLDVVEFMKHLTDERVKFRKAPFDHPQLILPNGVKSVSGGEALDETFVLPAVGRDGGDPFMPFEEALTTGY
jgi:choice-of-anchor C domain-containing protein